MVFFIGACLAFTLYIVYDVNSVLWNRRFLHSFFGLGTLLLAVSSLGCFFTQWHDSMMLQRPVFSLGLLPGAIGFVLMVWSLFFALPFRDVYLQPQQKPEVCDTGMYALCRHPGVLWLFLMYLGFGISWATPKCILFSALCSLLDVLYVVFQDKWTFPRTFSNYGDYQESTPFLIPTSASIHKAWLTRK